LEFLNFYGSNLEGLSFDENGIPANKISNNLYDAVFYSSEPSPTSFTATVTVTYKQTHLNVKKGDFLIITSAYDRQTNKFTTSATYPVQTPTSKTFPFQTPTSTTFPVQTPISDKNRIENMRIQALLSKENFDEMSVHKPPKYLHKNKTNKTKPDIKK
jgi:hypothetical protein